jgi:single-stranded-DNA-specific exonuclease
MSFPAPPLADRVGAAAGRLLEADRVLVASHIDADGLTAAGVGSRALSRAGVSHEVSFFDQLDGEAIDALAEHPADTILLTDFGSGQAGLLQDSGLDPIVADHHQPDDAAAELTHHCNPLDVGIDGAAELSGAGVAYLLGRALAERRDGGGPAGDNSDLATLAVVGAVGDVQTDGGALQGPNAEIAAEGEAVGVLESAPDLACFGRQTRPLPKLLSYADVRVPGVTNDRSGAAAFLQELPITARRDGEWSRWVDLDPEERQTVASALVRRAVERGVPAHEVDELIATSYTLVEEPVGSELRDASEFATLLNATARYDRAGVGLDVCLGDRDDALAEARDLLRTHRRTIAEGIDRVRDAGIERSAHCQWFHAEDRIPPTVVGIVAGMTLGIDETASDRPIVAFANDGADDIKVSSRAPHRLVREGLDLSTVMSEAAAAVDGEGGGHDVAAGATIPAGTERAFLDSADERVAAQLGRDE